jgi:hypothetical protein
MGEAPQLPLRNIQFVAGSSGARAVESHIWRKTSEMWGTRRLVEGIEPKSSLPRLNIRASIQIGQRVVEVKPEKPWVFANHGG